MPDFNSYCAYCADLPEGHRDRLYHDLEYGFPIEDDAGLFGRLILEINQAGLSWTGILKKRSGFLRAYDGFDPEKVAAYDEAELARLLADPGIVRNRLKVQAAVYNARAFVALRGEYGSFKAWLDAHHLLSKDEWLTLFKSRFHFVGGKIVGEFLMSSGYLPGAHVEACPVGDRAIAAGAAWARA